MHKKMILISIITASLTGCFCPAPAKEIVYKETIKVPVLPDTMVSKVKPTKPPSVVTYSKLKSSDKEKALTLLIINLYSDVHICNAKLDSIGSWYYDIIDKTKIIN